MLPSWGRKEAAMTKQESDALVASVAAQLGFARLRQVGAKPCAMTVDDFDGGFGVKISVEFGAAPAYFGTMITTEWQADQFFISVLGAIAEETAGAARNRTQN
jgi:hypothetical protein